LVGLPGTAGSVEYELNLVMLLHLRLPCLPAKGHKVPATISIYRL